MQGAWPMFAASGLGSSVAASLLDTLHGRVTAVDVSNWLHTYGRAHAAAIMLNSNVDAAVQRIVALATRLTLAGASLVFVFDCRQHKYAPKQRVDDKRSKASDAAWAAYVAGAAAPGAEALLLRAFRVTQQFQDAVFTALQVGGFTCVASPREADHQLARLYHDAVVDQVMSLDSDLIIHDVGRIIYQWDLQEDTCRVFSWGPLLNVKGSSLLPHALGRLEVGVRRQLMRVLAVFAGCDYAKVEGMAMGQASVIIVDAASLLLVRSALVDDLPLWCAKRALLALGKRRCSVGGQLMEATELRNVLRDADTAFCCGPAFSFNVQRFVPLESSPTAAQLVYLGYSFEELNGPDASSAPSRALQLALPPGAQAAVFLRGAPYASFPTRRYTPGAEIGALELTTATVNALKTWLSHSGDTRGGSSALARPQLVEMVVAVSNELRYSLLPESALRSAADTPGYALPHAESRTVAAPRPPLMHRNRVADRVPANADGTFPAPFSNVVPAVAGPAAGDNGAASDAVDVPHDPPPPVIAAVPAGAPVRLSPSSSGFRFYDRSVDLATCWSTICPVVSCDVLFEHFNDPRWHVSSKPLVKGEQECMLARAAPPITLAVPTPAASAAGASYWVELRSHASYGKTGISYDVTLELGVLTSHLHSDDVINAALTLPRARRVRHAHCSCVAGLSGHCWHVAYALNILLNERRPENREAESPTASLQRWNHPSTSSAANAVEIKLRDGATRAAVQCVQACAGGRLSTRLISQQADAASVGARGAWLGLGVQLPPRDAEVYGATRLAAAAAACVANGNLAPAARHWDVELAHLQHDRLARYSRAMELRKAEAEILAQSGAAAVKRERKRRLSLPPWQPPAFESPLASDWTAALAAARTVVAAEQHSRKRRAAPLPADEGEVVDEHHGADDDHSAHDDVDAAAPVAAVAVVSTKRGPRPYFHTHPNERVIASCSVPSPLAPDPKLARWCSWCGWVASAQHFSENTQCKLWETNLQRIERWRLAPTLRRNPRPALVVPSIGMTFLEANPEQPFHKR